MVKYCNFFNNLKLPKLSRLCGEEPSPISGMAQQEEEGISERRQVQK